MAARHWKSFPDPSGRPPTGRVRLRTRRISGPSVRHPRDQASGQAGPLGGSLAAASRGKQVSDMDRLPAMRLPDCRERGSAGSDGLAGAVSGCEGAHTKATAEPAWNASPVPDLLSVGAGASALRGSRARACPAVVEQLVEINGTLVPGSCGSARPTRCRLGGGTQTKWWAAVAYPGQHVASLTPIPD